MHGLIKSVLFFLLFVNTTRADSLDQGAINNFIDHMVKVCRFDEPALRAVFNKTRYSQRVIDSMTKPAEALPWYKYRSIFVERTRIEQGRMFWEQNKAALDRAEREYGVPANIIVAIIGVETRYGKNTGSDRVMDALATLAFHYPQRADFFIDQLEQYLLLTREQGLDPLSLYGSYAGAMGLPQFTPSSYRNYAIDFDQDGKKDIWNNPVDAIGSVANYIKRHGWETDQQIAVPGRVNGHGYMRLLSQDLKPGIMSDELVKYDVQQLGEIPPNIKVKLIRLDTLDGDEVWLGLNNFYVITRYNQSQLYAMAVFQLSDEILEKLR
jgi:lytic murein transglycosylase B